MPRGTLLTLQKPPSGINSPAKPRLTLPWNPVWLFTPLAHNTKNGKPRETATPRHHLNKNMDSQKHSWTVIVYSDSGHVIFNDDFHKLTKTEADNLAAEICESNNGDSCVAIRKV